MDSKQKSSDVGYNSSPPILTEEEKELELEWLYVIAQQEEEKQAWLEANEGIDPENYNFCDE